MLRRAISMKGLAADAPATAPAQIFDMAPVDIIEQASSEMKAAYIDGLDSLVDELTSKGMPWHDGVSPKHDEKQQHLSAQTGSFGDLEHLSLSNVQCYPQLDELRGATCKDDVVLVQCGDLVVLGDRAPTEYKSCPAVVTKVADSHCTVTVLDSKRQVGIGECWPGLNDLCIENYKLRVGAEVVIGGMSGAQRQHLNGLAGVVVEHAQQGHPVWITKRSCPETPTLTVCISFHDPIAAKMKSAFLEPRFISLVDDVKFKTEYTKLADLLATLADDTLEKTPSDNLDAGKKLSLSVATPREAASSLPGSSSVSTEASEVSETISSQSASSMSKVCSQQRKRDKIKEFLGRASTCIPDLAFASTIF
jgi:hypothetical protein